LGEVGADGPAVEIELGTDIRVRFAMTAPKELACAVIKALTYEQISLPCHTDSG
jgi:hypothetical protein